MDGFFASLYSLVSSEVLKNGETSSYYERVVCLSTTRGWPVKVFPAWGSRQVAGSVIIRPYYGVGGPDR